MSKPRNPGYQGGNNWGICDRCGQAYRQTELVDQHDGLRVCVHDCYDKRHPQEAVRDKGWECGGDGAAGTGLDWNGAGRLARPDVDPLSFIQEPNDAYFTTIPQSTFGITTYPLPDYFSLCAYSTEEGDKFQPYFWWNYSVETLTEPTKLSVNGSTPPTVITTANCGEGIVSIGSDCAESSGSLSTDTHGDNSALEVTNGTWECDTDTGRQYLKLRDYVWASYDATFLTPGFMSVTFVLNNVEGAVGQPVVFSRRAVYGNPINYDGLYRYQYNGEWYLGYRVNAYSSSYIGYDGSSGSLNTQTLIFRGVPLATDEKAIIRVEWTEEGFAIIKNGGEYIYQTNAHGINGYLGTNFSWDGMWIKRYWGGAMSSNSSFAGYDIDVYDCLVIIGDGYLSGTIDMTESDWNQLRKRKVDEYFSAKHQIGIPTDRVDPPPYSHGEFFEYNEVDM